MNKQYARDFCTKEERHKILKDWSEQGLRIVIKTCHSHFTTYIGVSENHPLANLSYDDVGTFIKVHGGLTFGGLGDDKYLPKGFYWYGWDYAHAGDYSYYEGISEEYNTFSKSNDHDWILDEVEKEAKEAIWEFKQLTELAEKIKNKFNI